MGVFVSYARIPHESSVVRTNAPDGSEPPPIRPISLPWVTVGLVAWRVFVRIARIRAGFVRIRAVVLGMNL